METLPNEIESIIMDYKQQIEEAELLFEEAIRVFIKIEKTGFYIKTDWSQPPNRTVDNIIENAEHLIDTIICRERVTPKMILELIALLDDMESCMIRTAVFSHLEPLMNLYDEVTRNYDQVTQSE